MAKMGSRSAERNLGSMDGFQINLGNYLESARLMLKNPTREQWCHMVAAAVSILVITPITFMVADRRDPVVLQQDESYLTPTTIGTTQKFLVTYKVKEYRACDGEIAIRITDSTGRIFPYAVEPTVYRRTVNRDANTFVKERTAPAGMAPGPATYHVQPWRWCNVFQKYVWPIKSQDVTLHFTVSEKL